MSRLAIFAYASLVSRASLAETLGRRCDPPTPATLGGFARAWSLARDNRSSEKTFARSDGSVPSYCLGLNVVRAEEARAPNGALVEVSEAEVERLDLREMRYRRLEVTASISATPAPDGAFDAVFVYTARREHYHPATPRDSIVIAGYLRTVEAAFAALGPNQLARFRATTAEPPAEVTEATLVRDRIPRGNPRGW